MPGVFEVMQVHGSEDLEGLGHLVAPPLGQLPSPGAEIKGEQLENRRGELAGMQL